MPDAPLVVLIDAECALCCGTAAWLSKRDAGGNMVFASNRGPVARIAGEPPGGSPGPRGPAAARPRAAPRARPSPPGPP
ncbi:MAG: hypothetical protein ACO3ND_10665, partial [Opitutales bacterium]